MEYSAGDSYGGSRANSQDHITNLRYSMEGEKLSQVMLNHSHHHSSDYSYCSNDHEEKVHGEVQLKEVQNHS